MTELATFKSITELTEELFYTMVGDYFSAGDRIEEIQKLIADLEESEKKLPKMDAFETYAEYLAAARAHQSWHELTDPTVERLLEEQETTEKRRKVLTERLQELLPDNIWLRYGDNGIRASRLTKVEWLEKTYGPNWARYAPPVIYPGEFVDELEVDTWESIRPIPKTITRTKNSTHTPHVGVKKDEKLKLLLSKWRKAWADLPYVPQAAILAALVLASILAPFAVFGKWGLLAGWISIAVVWLVAGE